MDARHDITKIVMITVPKCKNIETCYESLCNANIIYGHKVWLYMKLERGRTVKLVIILHSAEYVQIDAKTSCISWSESAENDDKKELMRGKGSCCIKYGRIGILGQTVLKSCFIYVTILPPIQVSIMK